VHQRFCNILLTWYFFSFSTKTRFTTNGYTDPTSVFIVFTDAQIFIQNLTILELKSFKHFDQNYNAVQSFRHGCSNLYNACNAGMLLG
jgi:hypothetical protein